MNPSPKVQYRSVSLEEAARMLKEAAPQVRVACEAYEMAKRITQKDLRFEVTI